MTYLQEHLREVPGFPKSNINFYDISSWLKDPVALSILSKSAKSFKSKVDIIIGVDSRGFLVAMQMATLKNTPLVLARKAGKLPPPTDSIEYSLEYGTDSIAIEQFAIPEGSSILICDDLLATGGTIKAVADLVSKYNPKSISAYVWIECKDCNGREFLEQNGVTVHSLLQL